MLTFSQGKFWINHLFVKIKKLSNLNVGEVAFSKIIIFKLQIEVIGIDLLVFITIPYTVVFWYIHAFFMSNTFINNARPKLAKNQAKAKKQTEAKLLLFESYSN